MRKNIQEVFKAYLVGKPKGKLYKDSISTDGKIIYSYNTAILTGNRGDLLLNMQKYSVTTTRQQHALQVLLNKENLYYAHA